MRRWLRSAAFAVAGVRHGWASQRNFRIEVVLGTVAVLVALWVQAPLAPVLLSCALVLALELVNTAIEAVVDLASPQAHPLAKVAKDSAAGAVLLAATFAVLVALDVLLLPLLAKLGIR